MAQLSKLFRHKVVLKHSVGMLMIKKQTQG